MKSLGVVVGPGLLLVVVASCGARADLTDPNSVTSPPTPDASVVDGPVPPTCGNGMCSAPENCGNCPQDCGFCSTCGDGTCTPPETCAGCPQDCGSCAGCGDGFCTPPGENCVNCPQDCGVCATCGDGTCEKTETCWNCPQDCGKCTGCPDGVCNDNKTCISCPQDCGVCAVCGNGKCEGPYETCTNCPKDCGTCPVLSCIGAFTCAIKCIDLMGSPPSVSPTCLADCLAEGCADTQYFFDQAFNCVLDTAIFGTDGSTCRTLSCLMQACQDQISACLGSSCH